MQVRHTEARDSKAGASGSSRIFILFTLEGLDGTQKPLRPALQIRLHAAYRDTAKWPCPSCFGCRPGININGSHDGCKEKSYKSKSTEPHQRQGHLKLQLICSVEDWPKTATSRTVLRAYIQAARVHRLTARVLKVVPQGL